MIGRQISFFFTPTDENIFLQEIKERGDGIITDEGRILKINEASVYNKNYISEVFIKAKDSKIILKSNKFLDIDESEVIQYSRSISKLFFTPLPHPKITFESYVSDFRSGPPGALLYRDGKFIKPNDIPIEELRKEYESLLNKKDTRDNSFLEAGRLWAAMKYLNKEKKDFIQKEKWFKNWYDSYAKWIKKYCRISKSIYKDYIGEDAYKAYKEGQYILPDYYKWD